MEVANLPIEVQILLVAGYLGYKVFVTGRGVAHQTEDKALQIITFGSIGRLVATLFTMAVTSAFQSIRVPPEEGLILVAIVTVIAAATTAALWRSIGLRLFSELMRRTGVYRDDHQYSTWSSITAVNANWNYVQLHLNDGRTLESDFGQLDPRPLGDSITVNDDGFALYITAIYDENNLRKEIGPKYNDRATTISYVPRSTIAQIDIGWQPR